MESQGGCSVPPGQVHWNGSTIEFHLNWFPSTVASGVQEGRSRMICRTVSALPAGSGLAWGGRVECRDWTDCGSDGVWPFASRMNKCAGADVLAAVGTSKIILGHFSRFGLSAAIVMIARDYAAFLPAQHRVQSAYVCRRAASHHAVDGSVQLRTHGKTSSS